MKLVNAFFKLIRWPNLVFIALTQFLFYFSLFRSLIISPLPQIFSAFYFLLLLSASVFIAAGGYIINDYFDMHIDSINKPNRVVIDKVVKRRWAIVWHFVLSGFGILLSLFFSFKTGNWIIAIGNIGCVLLLWFYSTTFKKKLLIGNVIISALTAWVILVLYFAYTFMANRTGDWNLNAYGFDVRKLFKYTAVFAGFAFIISLIREVVKDLEDMEGDARYNCTTMPLAWGIPATKVFVAVWMIVTIAALLIIQLYAWQLGHQLIVLYSIVFVILPLAYLLKLLYNATSAKHYHSISRYIKFIMLAGILSMSFFYFS
ncbi:MAG: geranylgeranylglycerol-phosphate geranylgeranyltransferase [Ferruginibacter sp.]